LHERPSLWDNRAATGAWVEPLLEGRDCNRDALGAVVQVRSADGRTLRRPVFSGGTYASQSQLRVHLGLGQDPGPYALAVTWPCGRKETFRVEARTFPTLVEGAGTAVP